MARNSMQVMTGVAIVSGLVVAVGLYRVLAGRPMNTAQMPVVVAQNILAAGTELNKSDGRIDTRPAADVPPGAFSDTSSIEGRTTRASIPSGSPVVESLLVPLNQSPIRALLKPGFRAVSVFVDGRGDIKRLLQAGDRVDVVVTMDDQDNMASSRMVLQNIEVLMVPPVNDHENESNYSASAEQQEWVPVTLAVRPSDAEKLALAMKVGSIQLLVRGYEDEAMPGTTGVTKDTLLPASLATEIDTDLNKDDKETVEKTLEGATYRQIEVIKGQERHRQRFLESQR